MGQSFYAIGVTEHDGKLCLYQDGGYRTTYIDDIEVDGKICLGLEYDAQANTFRFLAGKDRSSLKPVGTEFSQRSGFWKGTRVGLFCYNTHADGGCAVFDDFVYPVENR
jgi:hypothetical protein